VTNPVISVRGLSKSFTYWSERPTSFKTVLVDALRGKFHMGTKEHFEALHDVSFEIRKGDFVGIMGKNGAGKSTLLKLISGIYTPTSGTIEVSERIAPLIELGAGFHADLSGYENIFLNAAILGFGRKAAHDALPGILEFADLGEMIYMPARKYSSGMLVRLGFAVATHLDEPILLVDEVLAVGDAGFQAKCLKKVHELHKQGRTIILVTHDPKAVVENCNRCLIVANHGVKYDGAPPQAVQTYLAGVGQA
jgi:ABC-type polysaccharide/polyol phosphate transport system ATPase subunit